MLTIDFLEPKNEERRRFVLKAQSVDTCTFRIYLAKPWEFDFLNLENSKYEEKIEFDVTVYTID